ncbi:MAG: DUF3574 domain-containing protein [Planctomycetota bacterium]|jgi:hypothetical protein
MRTINRKLAVFLCAVNLLSITGCASGTNSELRKVNLQTDDGTIVKTELFFGLSKPDGSIVSETEWQNFVDEYITPRFRKGLTIVHANGQWLAKTGDVIKEKTKIVILLHSDNEDANASIEYIQDKYKKLFQQKSVLRVTTDTNVSL